MQWSRSHLLVAFAFGCGASPRLVPVAAIASSSVAKSDRIAPAAPVPAPEARSARGVRAGGEVPFAGGQAWVGTYTCAQGLTHLALRIQHVENGKVDAVFAFEHDPSGARGSYTVRGEYNAAKLELILEPGDWIERPPNYVTVGLDGYVAGSEFWGTVTNTSCSTFSLSLSAGERPGHAPVSVETSR